MSEKMQSPFEKIYAPLPDVGAYLERIGYRGEVSSNLETLRKLMQCHLAAVPFENLDVFHGHLEPSLETERMFAKIVLNRRGGYCFELNGLFSKLLEAIGFSVSCTFARILFGRSFVPPKAHRVIIVEIQGEKYFCDIGFGGPVPVEPIKIVYDTVIESKPNRRYKFLKDKSDITLLIEKENEFVPLISFGKASCDPADFIPLNAFCAYSEYEPFRKKQMLWKFSENGRYSIDGDVLKVTENGEEKEIYLKTEAELRDALKKWFGIIYPGKLREWRSN